MRSIEINLHKQWHHQRFHFYGNFPNVIPISAAATFWTTFGRRTTGSGRTRTRTPPSCRGGTTDTRDDNNGTIEHLTMEEGIWGLLKVSPILMSSHPILSSTVCMDCGIQFSVWIYLTCRSCQQREMDFFPQNYVTQVWSLAWYMLSSITFLRANKWDVVPNPKSRALSINFSVLQLSMDSTTTDCPHCPDWTDLGGSAEWKVKVYVLGSVNLCK